MENELKGQLGELHATIQITRKATGNVETYQLIGRHMAEPEPKGGDNLSNSQHSGS